MSDTATATPPTQTQTQTRGRRKVRLGTVISDKMDKTVIVQVGSSKAHRLYRKTVRQRTRFKRCKEETYPRASWHERVTSSSAGVRSALGCTG